MSRRAFLTSAVAAAGLTVLSGCGDGELSGIGVIIAPPSGPVGLVVGDFPDLAIIDRLVRVPQQPIAVKRTGTSTFEAISMICTHQQCLTNIVNGAEFDCPCHRSRFSNSGAVLRGPAQEPLAMYTTSYNPSTDILTIS